MLMSPGEPPLVDLARAAVMSVGAVAVPLVLRAREKRAARTPTTTPTIRPPQPWSADIAVSVAVKTRRARSGESPERALRPSVHSLLSNTDCPDDKRNRNVTPVRINTHNRIAPCSAVRN
ncbi:hypothetical protein ELQ39_00090 [Streptomyces sp. GB4-14]|nr:hypothetical protein [Streptomyces sp. GB4-14]